MGRGWRDQAACIGKSSLFDLVDRESSFRRDITSSKHRDRAIRSHNVANFRAAVKICKSCPVLDSCASSAQGEDTVWTVRAGKFPGIFKTRGVGRPAGPAILGEDEIKEKVCKRGHKGHFTMQGGSLRCGECRRVYDRNRYKKDNPEASKHQPIPYIDGECLRGHVNMYRLNKKGYRFCTECGRIKRRELHLREREKKARASIDP